MDIEKLARKLEPLMPKEVQHWLDLRDSADAEMKTLVDQQIVRAARKRLGDYRKKILLSLPPRSKAAGAFQLGTVLYEKPKWPAGISDGELLQNLVILGRSGAGKTNVAFLILRQLVERRVPFLFLDWKRTARHLIPALRAPVEVFTAGRSLSELPFNPFVAPPGLERHVYVNHVIDVMAEAFTLGDGARSVLQKAITACYESGNHSPTVQNILLEVDRVPENHRVRTWKISTTRALQSMAFSKIADGGATSQEELVRRFLEGNTVIELDALDQGSKKFLIPILCLWLYYVRLGAAKREKLKLVIFVEEAHHILYRHEKRAHESLMNMLLRQCREIGIGMVVIDQHPHLLSAAALGNSYTSICLNHKDPADISRAAGLSGLQDDEKRYLTMLPVGQAIIKLQDRWREPFLVQFPLVKINKGAVTDERLLGLSRHPGKGTGRIGRLGGEFGTDAQVPVADVPLEHEMFVFLEDVLKHPDDGVKARYQRLRLSVRKGMALRGGLIDAGFLEAEEIKVGRSRKVLLRLRRQARELFGVNDDSSRMGRESLAHEYWKRYYARLFEQQGYRVFLEAPRKRGRVDVLAVKGPERVAIEVETGKSDVISNVKNDLLSKFDRVLVVATNEKAMEKVERKLAEAGLLISDRVDVVLRGVFGADA